MEKRMDGSSELRDLLVQYPDVSYIEIHYDGSGDSGDIGSCKILNLAGEEFHPENEFDLQNSLMDMFPNELHPGWENNEGGCGHIEIFVAEGTYNYIHTEYYASSLDYDHGGEF
jgi:hypothetical protein